MFKKLFFPFLIASAFIACSTDYWLSHPQPQVLYSSPSTEAVKKEAKEEGTIIHKNCLLKCPSGAALDNIIVDHDVLILSSNRNTKFADWVAYQVTPDFIEGPKRERNWTKDPKIDVQYTFIPSDYKGMSQKPYFFDRGHQAPLASFKNHPKWHALNYLSNITPQKKDLNRGPWKDLESAERKLVDHYGITYVLTGPYYDRNNIIKSPPSIRIDYIIPSGYWKIIAVKDGGGIKTVSFIFSQNTPIRDHYCNHLVNILDIEKKTGLRFFDGKPTLKDSALKEKIGCNLKLEFIKDNPIKIKKKLYIRE